MADVDLEKGVEAYDDREFDRALNTTQSSIGLNPGRSNGALDQTYNTQDDQYYDVESQHVERPQASLPRRSGELNGRTSSDHQQAVPDINGIPPAGDLDPAADRLALDLKPLSNEDFYSLMGMRPATSPTDSLADLALPHGLYDKIYKQMRYNNRKFKVFDIATYALLFLQIVISAIFIILGSLRRVDTNLTIAILGAVATVISGGLALMKGQGLPNRLRQTRDSLRNVMFEAEELYWDVRSRRPVLYKDIKKIREDYLRVLDLAREHHPDSTNFVDEVAQAGKMGGARRFGKR